MLTVVIAPSNVAAFPEGGGHFWVYPQYVLGLSVIAGPRANWRRPVSTPNRSPEKS